jgi:hypothetical protein
MKKKRKKKKRKNLEKCTTIILFAHGALGLLIFFCFYKKD